MTEHSKPTGFGANQLCNAKATEDLIEKTCHCEYEIIDRTIDLSNFEIGFQIEAQIVLIRDGRTRVIEVMSESKPCPRF